MTQVQPGEGPGGGRPLRTDRPRWSVTDVVSPWSDLGLGVVS